MVSRSNSIFAAPFFITALSACSTETIKSSQIDADAIYQQYSVEVNTESSQIDFSATLRVGGVTGTTVELEDPARIEFEGQNTKKENSLGTRYQIVSSLMEIEDLDYSVVYVDQRGTQFQNTITVKSISIAESPQEIRLGEDFNISLTGEDFVKRDTISVIIRQPSLPSDQEKTVIYVEEPDSGVGEVEITIPSSEISKLSKDSTADLEITREYFQDLENVTSKGGASLNSYKIYLKSLPVRP